MKGKCRWIYRPGIGGSHWAITTCQRGFNPLTRISDSKPYVGVADFYNDKLCPICGKPIEMDYHILGDIIGDNQKKMEE